MEGNGGAIDCLSIRSPHLPHLHSHTYTFRDYRLQLHPVINLLICLLNYSGDDDDGGGDSGGACCGGDGDSNCSCSSNE